MKRLMLIAMTLMLAVPAVAFDSAKVRHQKTVKYIIEDIEDDIKRASHRGRFEMTYTVRNPSNDAFNQITNALLDRGYSVILNCVGDDYKDFQIDISWREGRDVKESYRNRR